MSENNNTTNTKEKQYHHLKKEDRIKIEALINQKDENGKCLLTLYIRKTHFMLIFLLQKKDSASVNARINFLKQTLGIKLYSKVFRILLTDNGSEFFSVLNFERDFETGKKVSNIFFCHPYSSYEKHGIEVNHEYIRIVLPKGTLFNNLNDNIIKNFQDNNNAIPRLSLNGETHYNLTKKIISRIIRKTQL